MGVHLKRKAKAVALEAASWRVPGGGMVAKSLMNRLKTDFHPPTTAVEYPGQTRAAACMSIDFDANSPQRKAANHVGTFALVDLSEKYEIPLTWAICGKDAEADQDAYQRLKRSTVRPDIGVHTYSHIDVSKSSAEEVEAEVKRCIGTLGLSTAPRTFVFPWNREAHFPVIAKLGFTSYRAKQRAISAPMRSNGMWNIPPVYYIDQKSIGAGELVNKYLDLCVRYRSVFHLWTHPWGLVEDGTAAAMVRTTLEPVFSHMKDLREAGLLSTTTMADIAACSSESELNPVIPANA